MSIECTMPGDEGEESGKDTCYFTLVIGDFTVWTREELDQQMEFFCSYGSINERACCRIWWWLLMILLHLLAACTALPAPHNNNLFSIFLEKGRWWWMTVGKGGGESQSSIKLSCFGLKRPLPSTFPPLPTVIHHHPPFSNNAFF